MDVEKKRRRVLEKSSAGKARRAGPAARLARARWEFMRRSPEYRKDFARLNSKNEKELAKKYGLPGGRMLDPSKKFLELDFEDRFRLTLPRGVKLKFDKSHKVEITIDLSIVMSARRLKEHLGELVDEYIYLFAPDLTEKFNRADAANRSWDNVLLAGELEAAGMKPSGIARRLFPNAWESKCTNAKDLQESARTNAARLRAEYHRMIEGGYRELSFP